MAIIGPDGSGKTTLLFNLALLTTPPTGTISYSNVPVKTGYQMLLVRRRDCQRVSKPLLLAASVYENVMQGLKLRHVAENEAKQRTLKWLKAVRCFSPGEEGTAYPLRGEANGSVWHGLLH